MLAAVTLVGDGAGDGGASAGAGCKARLSPCLMDIVALSGLGSDPKLLKQKP